MDKTDAKKLIEDTLKQPFCKDRFRRLTANILKRPDETRTFPYGGKLIYDAFAEHVARFERVCKYEDPDGKTIEALIVHLKKETSLERARTMQRNFIARYLNGGRGDILRDAALVAFVSPNGNGKDWRFSFVKMEYTFDEQGKVKEEFTPARRYSFLVGENEASHTAQSCLLSLLTQPDSQNPKLEQVEGAFSVETVTDEFFEKYRGLFVKIQESLDGILENDAEVKANFDDCEINTADFAKKLLGQLVFLYFLQKKGWFGVGRGEHWGTGPKDFLRRLFQREHGDYQNFFNDILEPLFYNTLAVERGRDWSSTFSCRIPFLNGGLFDPIGGYNWQETDIHLPDALFSNGNITQQGDTGDGVLDIFDRYNFTVNEDEPLEKEVAIDPEMLGKVFERMLPVKDKKSSGTYYTPREIVHYMCQQSLINHLATELEGSVNRADIETLVKYGDTARENDARVAETGKETKTYRFKLPENVRNFAQPIDDALAKVRACDPAVGSGAFMVGMMTEIVRTRTTLNLYLEGDAGRTAYNFKRRAIQDSLYGVDIALGAVEVAKLRLWLSLIVDEEERETIQPLPNLDYKIVQGNALLSVERDFFNYDLFDELETLKPKYFNETSPSKKADFKKQIDELIAQITNGRAEFDFNVHFSEVFHEKGGFDITIANPPYVSYGLRGGQRMEPDTKEFLRKNFPNSAEYKISLYAVFMDRGLQIAKPDGGFSTYIVPDSFLLGRYFSKIRKEILKISEIDSILFLPFAVFRATVGFSVVYLLQRKSDIDSDHRITARLATGVKRISNMDFKELTYPQTLFHATTHNRFRLFFDKPIMELICKLDNDSENLRDEVKFSSGLISKTGQDNIISKYKKSADWLSGIISGKEIQRYSITAEGNFICYDPDYIKSGYGNIDYSASKIFMRQTGDQLICAFDNDGLLALNNIHIGYSLGNKMNLKCVTAILNSRLLNFYYKIVSLETGRAMAQTDIESIEMLPLKLIKDTEQQPFVTLVDKILTITKDANYPQNPSMQAQAKEYETQIDQLVYQLYGLTPEEIAIVEGKDAT